MFTQPRVVVGRCALGLIAFAGLFLSESLGKEDKGGRSVADAHVRDIYGVDHPLSEFLAAPTEAIVLVFCQPSCPVVNQYLPRLRELHQIYNGLKVDRTGTPIRKGEDGKEIAYQSPGERVLFLAIYSGPELSVREMATHTVNARIPFRALSDAKQEVMGAVGATRFGEVALIDREGIVRYRGMTDDQYFAGGAKPTPSQHYLRDAIDALLAGKKIEKSERPGRGCVIPKREAKPSSQKISFHSNVEAILQKRCQVCHRPGMIGPMPLTNYAEVKAFGPMVAEVVGDRRMPPWPGDSPHAMNDDRRLAERERSTILDWVAAGMPEGDPKDAPAAPKWPVQAEWAIGKPDLVLEMPETFSVPPTGIVDYVYYQIPMNLPADRYIRSLEIAAGDPSVVHHIQLLEFRGKLPGEQGIKLSPLQQAFLYGPNCERLRLLGAYAPGGNDNARSYDPTRAMKLAAGSSLLMEVHYTTTGRSATDRSRLAIQFADGPPQQEVQTQFFRKKRGGFVIPSNFTQHTMQQLYYFEKPVRILGIKPHMHSRGRSYRLELVKSADIQIDDLDNIPNHDKPRGERILTIPIWDFNWQLTYSFEKPLILRPGQALLATGYWDNSRFNPRNPDWKKDVYWGLQVQDEMFSALFFYEELDEKEAVSAKDH